MSAWLKWLSGGGGVALTAAALEAYRRFLEIRDAGVEKAGEAGVLQAALDSCHASEQVLAAALKTCGG